MSAGQHEPRHQTWARFRDAVRAFFVSREGRAGLWMALGLVSLLIAINGLNVVNSYVGRDFISAIEHRQRERFVHQAWLYIGVFALSTAAAVIYTYLEQRLGLLWRDWQTRQLLDRYLARRAYYRLAEDGSLQNPDQRIAEDVRSFTTVTLSFALMTTNSLFTIFAFSGVLWSISPSLFGVAVAYALAGTLLTVLLGRRLIGLNGVQLDSEANFRFELMQVRDNAESVAVLHQEQHLLGRVLARLGQLVGNTRRMISVTRNLGFFTTGYNYLIQIVPALVIAPAFIRGEVDFGVVTQSAMAFTQLMGAFSLAVTQFQSISSYAATIVRLGQLTDAIDGPGDDAPASRVELSEQPGALRYEGLSLRGVDERVLLRSLDLVVEPGQRLLVTGSSGHAKVALFKATAGLYTDGEGTILRPDGERFLFLPERPYLPHGSLRAALLPPLKAGAIAEAAIADTLRRLRLDTLPDEVGGLDAEHDWSSRIGVGEQARLLIARTLLARPAYVFLDRMNFALDRAQMHEVLGLLRAQGIGYLVLGQPEDADDAFDAVLDLGAEGAWRYRTLRGAPSAP